MDYLKDVLLGIWLLWCAPEFDWVRHAVYGGIVGAVLMAIAMWDWRRETAIDKQEEEA